MRLILVLSALGQLALSAASIAAQAPAVRYQLRATIDDVNGHIVGTAVIQYQHRGTDTLHTLALTLPGNVFRPHARAWPALAHAPDSTQGFQRIAEVMVDGARITPSWPFAPDSTVARLLLPRGLHPGDSTEVTLKWEARLPALPWRRERLGRRLDLIGWYPQVLDETSTVTVQTPALSTVLLDIEVPDDQVMAGAGVLLCGDPGWTTIGPDSMLRVRYESPRDPNARFVRCADAPAGRKRLVWYAEDVIELAFALSPHFQHEQGDFLHRPVHAFFERAQVRTWGAGMATRRMETALAWTHELGGQYPWPQITIVEGVDQTDHVLPMVVFARNTSQAALLHSVGLLLTQQVLIGGDPVFTLGTAAFQGAWFFESLGRRNHYRTVEREILDWDLDGLATADEPLPQSSLLPCASTFCRRTEFMSFQLRNWTGNDQILRDVYRTVYTRNVFQPVRPGSLQEMARELVQPIPDVLYGQLARGGTLYNDAIVDARRRLQDDGSWRTTVTVERRERGIFPQMVWVIAAGDTGAAPARALTRREILTITTRTRPQRVVLDPHAQSHDWNMLDNQRVFGFRPERLLLVPHRPVDHYVDSYFARRESRDHLTLGWAPTLWFNDAGGWTYGVRLRENYLGRFEQNEVWLSLSTGAGTARDEVDVHGRVQLQNPVWLRAPRWSQRLLLAREEGRAAAELEFTHRAKHAVADATTRTIGIDFSWFMTIDTSYLDPRYYDDAGTFELAVTGARSNPSGPTVRTRIAAGYSRPQPGSALKDAAYARAQVEATMRERELLGLLLNARLFGGAVWAPERLPRQRWFYLAGLDPYEQFHNPLSRSVGSVLNRSGGHYQSVGGAGVRGLDPHISAQQAIGANVELEYPLKIVAAGPLVDRAAVGVFVDAALANRTSERGNPNRFVADAGLGLRLNHRIGATSFQTHLDFPLYVSRPELARADAAGSVIGFRWSWSIVRLPR